MNRQKTKILKWLRHLCLGCMVVFGLMAIVATGGSDDEASSGGETILLEWQDDQIIVEVTSGGDTGDILTTPVGSLNSDDTSQTNLTLTQLRIDIDNNGIIDEVYAYEYDSDGYLEKKEHYSTDGNGDPAGEPDEIIEYNVDSGVLDEIEYDTGGDGTVNKIIDYSYDDGVIDKEEIYNSSSKDGDPDETWRYDYDASDYVTEVGAYFKEHYTDDDDSIDEIIVFNSHGDRIKFLANPDGSGEFQSVITITIGYDDDLGNIVTTTTNITTVGGGTETYVATYEYEYDSDNNIKSYEAVEVGDNGAVAVTYFIWE
ncbi:MAG: hypothetical protein JRI91_12680 [Deltaproteobacteria bacterium]|nr:hypothetical protein [Deltaproteobacteria bacterium]